MRTKYRTSTTINIALAIVPLLDIVLVLLLLQLVGEQGRFPRVDAEFSEGKPAAALYVDLLENGRIRLDGDEEELTLDELSQRVEGGSADALAVRSAANCSALQVDQVRQVAQRHGVQFGWVITTSKEPTRVAQTP